MDEARWPGHERVVQEMVEVGNLGVAISIALRPDPSLLVSTPTVR